MGVWIRVLVELVELRSSAGTRAMQRDLKKSWLPGPCPRPHIQGLAEAISLY